MNAEDAKMGRFVRKAQFQRSGKSMGVRRLGLTGLTQRLLSRSNTVCAKNAKTRWRFNVQTASTGNRQSGHAL